jgi:L-asparaginase
MHIHCIQTGGTIDKTYPQGATHHGYNFEITTPAIARILSEVHAPFEYTVTECLKKDSLDITDADRNLILKTVADSPHEHIIVTHGTDTMHVTASVLREAQLAKVIVLTGAMLPESMKGSDASFNIGMAYGALQTLPHGVYIVLYGSVWNLDAYIQKKVA